MNVKIGGGVFAPSEIVLNKFVPSSPYIPDSRPMNWYQTKSVSFWKLERQQDLSAPYINPVFNATLNSELKGGTEQHGVYSYRTNGVWMGSVLGSYGYLNEHMIPYPDNDAPPEIAQNEIMYPHMKIG